MHLTEYHPFPEATIKTGSYGTLRISGFSLLAIECGGIFVQTFTTKRHSTDAWRTEQALRGVLRGGVLQFRRVP
jgi:hypothetical protein